MIVKMWSSVQHLILGGLLLPHNKYVLFVFILYCIYQIFSLLLFAVFLFKPVHMPLVLTILLYILLMFIHL